MNKITTQAYKMTKFWTKQLKLWVPDIYTNTEMEEESVFLRVVMTPIFKYFILPFCLFFKIILFFWEWEKLTGLEKMCAWFKKKDT